MFEQGFSYDAGMKADILRHSSGEKENSESVVTECKKYPSGAGDAAI